MMEEMHSGSDTGLICNLVGLCTAMNEMGTRYGDLLGKLGSLEKKFTQDDLDDDSGVPEGDPPLKKAIAERGMGYFIVFEGLDGSGTTTQMKLLAEYLRSEGIKVMTTCEPTESPIGKAIDEILKGDYGYGNDTMMSLFALDRKEHVKHIREWVKQGYVVLCDRYYHSSFVYQGRDATEEERMYMYWLNRDFPKPDLTIFLDVYPDTCIDRIEARGEAKELYEKRETLHAVSDEYDRYMDAMYYIEDGSIESVASSIRRALWKLMP